MIELAEESELLIPTEYRIVPIQNHVFFYYLQFKHVHRYKKRRWFFGEEQNHVDVSWRFIYENDYGLRDVLYPEQCPSELPDYDFRCLRSYNFDQGRLLQFAKKWTYIEDYYTLARRKLEKWKQTGNKRNRTQKSSTSIVKPRSSDLGFS